MPRPRKSTVLRAALGVALIYLVGDLGVWHGPLYRRHATSTTARDRQVVARVCNHPVTRSQFERAVCEHLWLAGKANAALTPQDRQIARAAALEDVINHELLRCKAAANVPQLTVGDAEITERLNRFRGRFESNAEMASAMKSQGIASEHELRAHLAARLQQEKYVESRVGPLAQVTDEEARQWFADNRRNLTNPERVEVRHIFIATLDTAPEVAKAKLAAAQAELTDRKKDFATLARELSEDPASTGAGGSLGWMTRARLPADFAAAVFALAPHTPTLVRTRIGWHLVEVTGRKPAEPRTFEQAKPEIRAALEAVKRQQAATQFRAALRQFEASNIEVFPDQLTE